MLSYNKSVFLTVINSGKQRDATARVDRLRRTGATAFYQHLPSLGGGQSPHPAGDGGTCEIKLSSFHR